MLTNPQKRFLRKNAHSLHPIFQVGKGGVTPNMVIQIAEALEARELIKVSILQNCEVPKEEVAETLSSRSGAELVQVIGRTIILYKESKNKKQIVLP
ncbi:ribosome assembly RNA-binding protein YhbY [Listeria fleischmannii]|jgi:RNA-binding protein|uniref:Ribosome assembly RNA-binding protein YhbY n=1 Tax=Listeria fleischmannii TaxID=1069827 RepID=A0A841YG69_9LIST|nr:ribosome assembly RNA-binding protein YhbY [Listeria fleischmannii]EIA20893.1 CRS1 / YhbY domain family protein [Listeria fleischmannii subsp. coloradonensis]MBC1399256.1 ribosome assembly RNA-binding protein YhbY [Listeria fleischmannii]MBC1419046.1 ribosome assembly RNA-binding protein YhbY [Listeria fleischmannii]MBC1427592.1 ribosome assembly RNA-binding protein YhbY [Listeria fleischmannii]STY34911.1 RNA-binding protein YhbY [Listeria fleischmannii subsp. coloradonensis]